jgi:hypothetical protein
VSGVGILGVGPVHAEMGIAVLGEARLVVLDDLQV